MKKGFTLIELLAVIVILAIIALIAAPIVINIINDSKEASTLRSADSYVDAVEYSLAKEVLTAEGIKDGNYKILESGNVCLKYIDGECSEELNVGIDNEKPIGGNLTIKEGTILSIELTYGEKTVVKNNKGEMVYQTSIKLTDACTLKSGSPNTVGSKYECDFGGGPKTFYVLESGENKVIGANLADDELALILHGNYDASTHPYCDQSGVNKNNAELCHGDGLDAKLDEIAGVWNKLNRNQITLPTAMQIVAADGQNPDNYVNGPSISTLWLFNWPGKPGGEFDPPYGYWTLTPKTATTAYLVGSIGLIDNNNISISDSYGIRPVVNIKK